MLNALFGLYLVATGSQAEVNGSGASMPTDVRPMGEWVEFRKARYTGEPLLLHLRNGYERAVLMPEPIKLLNDSQTLPGCAVVIDTDVIGFFPTRTFAREPIRFIGLQSGSVYELRVRASPEGIRQPLQITR
ncbi:hypothetical protein [Granulosicoccus sp. 3-233]|uniref:hypothetical protein n=1 Tax=Granulosicoccus sp. 3-233 TaxID=3417969 RepID=UPI003D348CFA